jgi:hypothetical protein
MHLFSKGYHAIRRDLVVRTKQTNKMRINQRHQILRTSHSSTIKTVYSIILKFRDCSRYGTHVVKVLLDMTLILQRR